MMLYMNLIAVFLLGKTVAFAPVHQTARKLVTELSMAANEEGPVLNKWSR